jgi:hypothetical protein
MAGGVSSIPDAMVWLRSRFDRAAAGDLSASYRFELLGEGGGVITATVRGGDLVLSSENDPGEDPPDVLFRLTAGDFFDVLSGRANPDLLQMDDRMIVEGALALALKVRVIFSRRA